MSMKHQFKKRDSIDVPKGNFCWDFSPSWWEGFGVVVFYFGQKIVFWGLVVYLFVIFFK
jgi:hypothetical protein